MRGLFRASTASSPGGNLAKTLPQIVVFWGVFLWVIPTAFVALEQRLGLPRLEAPAAKPVAIAGFLAFSCLGLWSAATMAVDGRGTPLPFDTASRLVTGGPYAWVRNPMAAAGLGQGFFVGLALQSWITWAYVATGALLWNWLVRPVEEGDLRDRFGQEYAEYAARVRCWRPRIPNR